MAIGYASKLAGITEVMRRTHNESQTESTSHSSGSSHGATGSVSESLSRTHGTNNSVSVGFQLGSGSSSSGSSKSLTTGTTTSSGISQTRSEGVTVQVSHTKGFSEVLHQRPLLRPEELGRLFGDPVAPRTLILSPGSQPLALRRVPYYRLQQFDERYDPHPDHRAPPTRSQRRARERALLLEQERRAREAREAYEARMRLEVERARFEQRLIVLAALAVAAIPVGLFAFFFPAIFGWLFLHYVLPVLLAVFVVVYWVKAMLQPRRHVSGEEAIATAYRMWGRTSKMENRK